MRMRKLFFSAVLVASQLCFAQGIDVLSTEQIQIASSEGAFAPIMSPNGEYLLVTSNTMSGLMKYDLATKETSTISSEMGAGYDVIISSDGSTIAYREKVYKNKLRYTTVKSVDVATGASATIVDASRTVYGVAAVNGTTSVLDGTSVKSKTMSNKAESTVAVASIVDSKLYISANGKTKELSPNGTGADYLWASVSPDGTKVLYYVINSARTYVCNLDGSEVTSIGTLRAPKWMGNDWVVGMMDKDDGHVVTASKIVVSKANGTFYSVLTDESEICMYPSASADASKIVYNTASGKVYLMNVETK